jgi:amidase
VLDLVDRTHAAAAGGLDHPVVAHYIAWMKSAYWITATFCPAISVPAGFTPEGWPVGIQIVGRTFDDASVFKVALAFEKATGGWFTGKDARPKL